MRFATFRDNDNGIGETLLKRKNNDFFCSCEAAMFPNNESTLNNNNEEPWCDIFALCHQLSEEAYGLQHQPYNKYGWIQWTNALDCHSYWFPADGSTATR